MRVFYNEEAEGGTATMEKPKAAKKKAVAKHQTTSVAGGTGKSVKKTTKKKATAPKGDKEKGEHGIERSKDLPWCPKKVALFKALKALKAFGTDSARSAKDVAAKAGFEKTVTVLHYGYHAKAAGLVGVVQGMEEIRGNGFYLTSKGAALNPEAEFKAIEKAKSEKKPKAKKDKE
jgi:hypothetical protein